MMTKNELYEKILHNAQTESNWPDEWSDELAERCTQEELLQDLEILHQAVIDRCALEDHPETRNQVPDYLARFQEVKYCIIIDALRAQCDPSVIPHLMKYVPYDQYGKDGACLEDYVTQCVTECIENLDFYDEGSLLLEHIHELIPEKMVEAWGFLMHMVDFGSDGKPFIVKNFDLVQKKPFLELLNYSIKRSLEELKESKPEQVKNILWRLECPLNNTNNEDEYILQIGYVRQEFLKLYGEDV